MWFDVVDQAQLEDCDYPGTSVPRYAVVDIKEELLNEVN